MYAEKTTPQELCLRKDRMARQQGIHAKATANPVARRRRRPDGGRVDVDQSVSTHVDELFFHASGLGVLKGTLFWQRADNQFVATQRSTISEMPQRTPAAIAA